MPMKSEAQRKWMWANHPEMAKRWEEETPKGKKLPKKVKKQEAGGITKNLLMAKSGIHIKKSHEGLLHKNLGIKKGEKIPASKLAIKKTDSPAVKKRKQFAINAKKWHHGEDGLLIPPLAKLIEDQQVSPYSPQMVSSTDYIDPVRELSPAPQKKRSTFDVRDTILGGLTALDRILPNHPIENIQERQTTYNQNPYGTGSEALYPDGGTIPSSSDSTLYSNWNRVVDYAKTKGYKPEQLDHDPNVGYGIIDEYNRSNPNNQFDRNRVRDIQKLMRQYREKTIDGFRNYSPEMMKVNNPIQKFGEDYSNFMPDLSKEDNFPGHRTLGWKVPVEYMPNEKSVMEGPIKGFAPITRGTTSSNQVPSMKIVNNSRSSNPAAAAYLRSISSSYDDGGSIRPLSAYMENGGQTFEFRGPSHEDGGIPIDYNGNVIEVEGGETGHIDDQGNLIVAGNMTYPGTNKKFKTISKQIANKENKVNKINTKASEIAKSIIDPSEKFDMLKSNSVDLMQRGSAMKLKDLSNEKQHMTIIQQAMLDTANEFNLDPQEMSKGNIKKAKVMRKKGKNGATIAYYDNGGISGPGDGKETMSDRNNNPGNIKINPNTKYGKLLMQKYGATLGEKSSDGGYFAKFPDRKSGKLAMRNLLTQGDNYKNSTVTQAINRWTNNKPYDLSGLADIKDKKISELSPDEVDSLLNYMTKGEGTKYPSDSIKSNSSYISLPPVVINGKSKPLTTQLYTPQMVSSTIPISPDVYPTTTSINNPEPIRTNPFTATGNKILPSNREDLAISQLYPEMFAAASNTLEPVDLQQYNPQLKQPYQVSFQDRLNENNASFNSIEKLADYNPTALSTLAGQKYAADSNVLADEFRQNDSQNRGIYNENINTLNDAQLKNLQLADQQYVRQSEARSKTKATDQAILNSVASKYLQNKLENRQLQAAESYSGYRFNDNGQLEWYGGEAPIIYRDVNPQNADENSQGYYKVPIQTTKYKTNGYGLPSDTEVTNTQRVVRKKENGGSVSSLYSQVYGKHR